MRTFANTRNQGFLALALIIVFYFVGWVIDAPGTNVTATDFGGVLFQLAATWQVRSILAAIFIDAILGMIAALRVNQFNAASIGNYLHTNVLPYVFGYVLIALLSYPQITAVVYASVMTSVVGSILDNLLRAGAGTTPPSDAISANLPPAEPHA